MGIREAKEQANIEEECSRGASAKCCWHNMKLQSHWQLQKLISKTYATIPRNLTKSATIAQRKKLAEGREVQQEWREGKGDRQSPRHDSTITALHAWLLTFELSRDCG